MQQIDMDLTKFHGETFDDERDKKRLISSLDRISKVFQHHENEWIDANKLCELAEVSQNSYRNRISDLRVYHKMKIAAANIKDGLWKYKFVGFMTDLEHKQYLFDLRMKRTKPIGNEALWNDMWHRMRVYGAAPTQENNGLLSHAATKWAMALAGEIAELKYIV
jgi:hypothetical protein